MFASVCIVLHLPYPSLRRLEFQDTPLVDLIATPRGSMWREPRSTSDLVITVDEPVDSSCLVMWKYNLWKQMSPFRHASTPFVARYSGAMLKQCLLSPRSVNRSFSEEDLAIRPSVEMTKLRSDLCPATFEPAIVMCEI